jgi:hypothetical protein
MFMRTKSSIRIMMTIIMKLVPLTPSIYLSTGYWTRLPFYLLVKRTARAFDAG